MDDFPGIPWPAIGRGLARVTDVLTVLMLLMLGVGGMAVCAMMLLTPNVTRPADWSPVEWRHFLFGELVMSAVFILAAAFEIHVWRRLPCRKGRGDAV